MAWLLILTLWAACEARTLHVPDPYETIQSALDSVRDGDTVLVEMGQYAEALYAPPHSFLLLGEVPTDTGDVLRPVIDPTPLSRSDTLACLTIPLGAAMRIQNMTFRNGPAMFPRQTVRGGINCMATMLDVRYCTFDSTCTGIGTSFDNQCRVMLQDCRFLHNPWWCVIVIGNGELHAVRCLFSGVGEGQGDMVRANGRTTITHCVFRDYEGASMLLIVDGNNAVVDNNLFVSGNFWGSAVEMLASTGTHFTGMITSNVFDSLTVARNALWIQPSCGDRITVRGNVFRNLSYHTGGGQCTGNVEFYCYGGGGQDSVIFEENVFGPVADAWLPCGEGLSLFAQATVRHNTFRDLESDTVAAICCENGQSTLTENNFVNTRLGLCKYWLGGDSLDARNNWWGDRTGPYDSLLNPQGRGAAILCNHEVLISPWLEDPYAPNAASPPLILQPSAFILSAFPNPFNAVTRLNYELFTPGKVTLKVFDLLGRQVATLTDKRVDAGSYSTEWNAETYPSGIYFAVLRAADQHGVQKLLLLK